MIAECHRGLFMVQGLGRVRGAWLVKDNEGSGLSSVAECHGGLHRVVGGRRGRLSMK